MVTYPVPQSIQGQTSLDVYNAWVDERANSLRQRDVERKRPCALDGSNQMYRDKINDAVVVGKGVDPFTGDALRWDLIETWDPAKDVGHNDFMKTFCMLPTVDHKDPYGSAIDFEICSWLINGCKNDQTPQEFVQMCRNILEYRGRSPVRNGQPSLSLGAPRVYFLPDFLSGICTEAQYLKWLDKRAEELYVRDRDQKRPYGLAGSKESYKRAIHAAACANGPCDPYTGDTMTWSLIGTWNTKAPDGFSDEYREYCLLPTVDHTDPYADVFEAEICSWRINCCKEALTPEEFIAVCGKVAAKFPVS